MLLEFSGSSPNVDLEWMLGEHRGSQFQLSLAWVLKWSCSGDSVQTESGTLTHERLEEDNLTPLWLSLTLLLPWKALTMVT